MAEPSPNPEAVKTFCAIYKHAHAASTCSYCVEEGLQAVEPLIRTDERRKVLTELAEEFEGLARAASEDWDEQYVKVSAARGHERAAAHCRELAVKEESDGR